MYSMWSLGLTSAVVLRRLGETKRFAAMRWKVVWAGARHSPLGPNGGRFRRSPGITVAPNRRATVDWLPPGWILDRKSFTSAK